MNPDVVTIGATGGSGDNVAGATASIVEGSLRTISFVYDGSKGTNQKFTIPNRNVDNRYLKVRVQTQPQIPQGLVLRGQKQQIMQVLPLVQTHTS